MINNGEIPPYKIFTHEPAKKRQKRLDRENREAKEAEEMQEELGFKSGIYITILCPILTVIKSKFSLDQKQTGMYVIR